MPTTKAKKSRLDLRIDQDQKELLERAASLRGLSLSSYLLSNSIEAATKDIESHEKLVLSDNDRDLFLSLMENPPEPNQALKSAMKRFQEEYEN
ncbi:DUF1778 domain-containing protein [Rivularia sp. UHCC 0363]|uniref:type II toxin-antitoxin system TacA family antitoxin n=1 Tax=Rivularia sp. UHCC 0363 TaxID=3110244 RepID=UPI002B20D8CD|nr:DUF1778 domain-containing protein [Rivularia sp. UHCC 0363]MEA5599373.1 DUF1778 domain-containing protein [Rivularia sp. UHCC 0363]